MSDDAAVVHPGRLVRGLARAVERDGTRILEGTPVTGFRADGRERASRPGHRRAARCGRR